MAKDTEDQTHAEGTTRRDALKISGAAALGGVAAMLAGGAISTEVAAAATTPAHIPTSLRVSLNGVALAGIVSMEVLSGEYSTTSETTSTGQWAAVPTGLLAQRVSLTRHFSKDLTFVNLFQSVSGKGNGGGTGASLVVQVRGRRGSLINKFTLSDCTPIAWTGPVYDAAAMAKGGSGDRPTESLSLNFTKITWT